MPFAACEKQHYMTLGQKGPSVPQMAATAKGELKRWKTVYAPQCLDSR